MPVPNLVVKDADGKVIAQVASFGLAPGDHPQIMLDIDGVLVAFGVRLDKGWLVNGKIVYFSESGCQGTPYIQPPNPNKWWETQSETGFGVVGPDPDNGTYRMFRSTSPDVSPTFPLSNWDNGTCGTLGGGQLNLAPAEEVLPNPLGGFHGPTTANPERLLTVEGGTKLP
jgi:hypothetical protein